jgi:DNA-binding winged helix-turn-helix (wHTH) protein
MNKPPRRIFEFDSFRVDVAERQVWRDGKIVILTPKVFDILLILLENKGQTVEKEKIIQMVWAETFVEEGSLNRNVSTLRKILGDDSNEQRFIKTLPKRGYRFTANVREIVEDDALIVEKNTSYPVSVREEISDAETRGSGDIENFSVSHLISRPRVSASPRLLRRVCFAGFSFGFGLDVQPDAKKPSEFD